MSNLTVNVDWQKYIELVRAGKISHSQGITAPLKYHAEITENIAGLILGNYRPSHPDILIIGTPEKPPLIGDPDKANYTGTCRWLQENILLKPIESRKRLCIIYSADKLNAGAGNCLLKLTEEPPEYAYIIYLMEDDGKFLPTLRSRVSMTHIREGETISLQAPPMYMADWIEWLTKIRRNIPGDDLITPDIISWIEHAKSEENEELVYKLERLRIISSQKNLSVPMMCDLVMMTIMRESGREVDYILDHFW